MGSRTGKYSNPFDAIIKGVSDLMKKQPRIEGLGPHERLDGKTVLITGASSGLGLATAVECGRLGARVLMAVRSGIPEKGDYVKKNAETKKVEMLYVDLADFDSIDDFLQSLEQNEVRIDIFISNAAVVSLKSRKTKYGLEEMFMVNYFAQFYLTNKLIEKGLLNSHEDKSRIIFVASESHRNPEEFSLDGFGEYKEFGFSETVSKYGYFKMLLATFANELARRNTIVVRALCPGPVNSNIAREAPGWMKPLLKGVFSIFFRSPEVACEPVVYFAAENEPREGLDYLFLMSRVEMDEKVTDPGNARLLWKKSEELLEKIGR